MGHGYTVERPWVTWVTSLASPTEWHVSWRPSAHCRAHHTLQPQSGRTWHAPLPAGGSGATGQHPYWLLHESTEYARKWPFDS
jgi:hypothetical protein